MDAFKLSGNFSFDSRNIKSMDEFGFYLVIQFDALSEEQHLLMRSKISEHLGLRPMNVPKPWGNNPAQYEILRFETHPKDFERCKTMIKLLQEGGIALTANGHRYPPDSDHPLMDAVKESAELRGRIKNFGELKSFIGKTFAEAPQKSPSTAQSNTRKNTPGSL